MEQQNAKKWWFYFELVKNLQLRKNQEQISHTHTNDCNKIVGQSGYPRLHNKIFSEAEGNQN